MTTVVDTRDSDVAGPTGFATAQRSDDAAAGRPTVAGSRSHRIESLVIFALFGVAYGLLGHWLVVDQKVFTFGALQRLSDAYITWHGSPPKLAAVGFSMPPVQSTVLLPLAIFTGLAKSLVALPICSAVFGGLTMVAFNRLMDRCDMSPVARYVLLILNAAIPTIAFYSAGGGGEMISLWLLTMAISSLIAWFRTVDTRFLISAGLAFAFASMADYTNFVWMILGGMMVATVLARHGADDAEVEGSVITFVAPALYALALWVLINWLIVSSPFGWIHDSSNLAINVAAGHITVHSASVLQALGDSLRLALNAAPLSLVVAPALIITALVQRNEMAGWLAAFTIVAIFRPGGEALLHSNIADIQMSLSAPQVLMALVGGGWLYQSFPAGRPIVAAALMVGTIAMIIVVWNGINVFPYQNMEQAFHKAIAHTGTRPSTSLGGYQVGDSQETMMADYINRHVHAQRSVLTDNSQTFGVILETGHAGLFQTRLENGGTRTFLGSVAAPPRNVKYLLIAYDDPADAIRSAYPNAVSGHRSGLAVVYKDARYALVAVARGTTQKNSTASGQTARSTPAGEVQVNSF